MTKPRKTNKKAGKKKPEIKREMSPELRAMLNDYAKRMEDLLVTRLNRPKPAQPLIPLDEEATDEVREILPDNEGGRTDGGLPETEGGD